MDGIEYCMISVICYGYDGRWLNIRTIGRRKRRVTFIKRMPEGEPTRFEMIVDGKSCPPDERGKIEELLTEMGEEYERRAMEDGDYQLAVQSGRKYARASTLAIAVLEKGMGVPKDSRFRVGMGGAECIPPRAHHRLG